MGITSKWAVVWSLILVGCGEPAAVDVAAPSRMSSTAIESGPGVVDSTSSTSPTAVPSTTALRVTTTTMVTPAVSTAAPPVVVLEVEGVKFSVTLPEGARPDPARDSPAPVWATSSGHWIVDSCSCMVGFAVQTFIPPLYEPDRLDTFVDDGRTWNVYDSGRTGIYLSASTATTDGLWINIVGNNAPVDVIRAVASAVTITGVRDEPLWTGRVDIDPNTGAVSAPGFNDFVSTRQPARARTASDASLMLIGDTDDADETTTQISEEPGLDGTSTVTITTSNLPDDSSLATRYQFQLQQMTDTLFRFVAGSWTQQCQPGRGHEDFTPEPCS